MPQRVFVDANVLASRTCLDWLFFLRQENEGMFQLHSTEDVFAETVRVLRKKHPRLSGGVISDRRAKIMDCMDEVITDFPGNSTFTGSDEGDYHVHAAAEACRADMILTQNDVTDITQNPDDEHYDVISPDEFFLLVADSNPRCVVPITQKQFDFWCSRPRAIPLDEALQKAGCPRFAARVREALQQIALMP